MYNGIGILTPRGSGTSGYVTNNKFNLRGPPPQSYNLKEGDLGEAPAKKPNEGILEHNRKRELELEVEVMRAQLEDDG
jgi:serine/arginine repetitive matrix protein 2